MEDAVFFGLAIWALVWGLLWGALPRWRAVPGLIILGALLSWSALHLLGQPRPSTVQRGEATVAAFILVPEKSIEVWAYAPELRYLSLPWDVKLAEAMLKGQQRQKKGEEGMPSLLFNSNEIQYRSNPLPMLPPKEN